MLARSAQNLYWLSRYLVRAEHLCRLLQLQVETLVDRPRREIHYGWRRIYTSQHRRPPVATVDFEVYHDDDLTLADAYTLADDLTFETSNPDSLRSCFARGRESARQARNYLSFEMWMCLNRAWLRLQDSSLEKIWQPTPENFYARISEQLAAFAGITATTMYRAQGWHFLQLGRAIERAQQTSALLQAQQQLCRAQNTIHTADWVSLLRFYQALDTYQWHHPGHIDPVPAAQLLCNDPLLPHSLAYTMLHVQREIDALSTATASQDRSLQQFSERIARRFCASPPATASTQTDLGECHLQLRQLDLLLAARWFDYDVADQPPPS